LKNFLLFFIFLISYAGFSQNITVDTETYSPQQLVEDILINSGCIENVNVTGAVSGDFNSPDRSYGYFDGNGSIFPFENGIVLSTGRVTNVPGPNNSTLSDDASNWGPDQDLEQVLGITNTLNATVLEFDFTPNANSIQFKYIFASEEYRENNSSTCQYSDVFAFLIKPIGGTYENIAVVPGTDIPVLVTTVLPEIPGSCEAQNEEFFGSFNGTNYPINFNGQTKPLIAQTSVDAGTTYHIKLVIADDFNFQFDSAVFLEGNSFNIGADLGEDLTGANALCEGEDYTLSVTDNGNAPTNYEWFLVNNDDTETLLTQGPTVTDYQVSNEGTYKVVVTYGPNCAAEDSIEIEYVDFSPITNQTLSECDSDNDGLSIFNLTQANQDFIGGNQNFSVTGYFLTENNALNNNSPIPNPNSFNNTSANQEVYARILFSSGCVEARSLTLTTSYTIYNPVYLVNCYSTENLTVNFNFNNAQTAIEDESSLTNFSVNYYPTENDALAETNMLSNSFETEVIALPVSVYGKIETSSGCQGIIEVILEGIEEPAINPNYSPPILCEEDEDGVRIESGVQGNTQNLTYEWENGETTSTIQVDSTGTYQVNISRTRIISGETYTCTVSNSITVTGSAKAQISHEVLGSFDNYTVIITATGNGDYVYSIDDQLGEYQTSNIFEVGAGSHTIYVKDLNGCGIAFKEIKVLGYLRFFTPNQDGINDVWKLIGVERFDSQIENVRIFDRFGKLLKSFPAYGNWDGTYHGKAMPSNDYWFLINFKDGSDFKGHFTLKR
jgi:gliding motility-associated-like protein